MVPQRHATDARASPPTLLLTANFPPVRGGTARLFWELYRRAPPGRVRVVAGARPSAAELTAAAPHLAVVRLDARFPGWPLFSLAGVRGYRAAARALRRDLAATPARALHAARLLPEGWLALRSKARFACWVHGEELNSIRSSRQLRWMAHRVLDGAALLIANSHNTARRLEEWSVDPRRVAVLSPGVDCAWFRPAAPDAGARAELGWGQRPVVLTVGRLQARKGHRQMLDALPALLARRHDLLWAVVGDGELRATIERRVIAAGLSDQVRLHGELDESRLLSAYQQCDLFVLPNIEIGGDFEGFGMVLLEAQACARPVIAGASGGTGEAIAEGETGLRVDCADAAALAAAIERLLEDPAERRSMGELGRHRALAFDWPSLAARAVELWDVHGV